MDQSRFTADLRNSFLEVSGGNSLHHHYCEVGCFHPTFMEADTKKIWYKTWLMLEK